MARIPPPKVRQAADTVRAMIAGGHLLPGEIAPSAPELSERTGTCLAYCRWALNLLVGDRTLEAGRPPRGRPRVPREFR